MLITSSIIHAIIRNKLIMVVFVIASFDGSMTEVIGVCSTEQKAKDKIEELKKRSAEFDAMSHEERIVQPDWDNQSWPLGELFHQEFEVDV